MSLFKVKTKQTYQLGLGIHTDGVSMALVDQRESVKRVKACGFTPVHGEDATQSELEQLVKKHKLKGIPTVFTIDPDAYNLVQVESPEVEAGELRNAIQWRVKDLLEFHLDDAVLDLYDQPKSQRPGAKPMLSVVATRKNIIQSLVDKANEAQLTVEAIDITELTLRNLLSSSFSGEGFHLLLYLSPLFGMILVVKNDVLYLSRRIEVNSIDLEEQGGFGLEEIHETLALEVQRSLDFCETQYRMGAVSKVLVVAPESRVEGLIQQVSETLAVPVEAYDLNLTLLGLENLPIDQLSRCMPALGAALREG